MISTEIAEKFTLSYSSKDRVDTHTQKCLLKSRPWLSFINLFNSYLLRAHCMPDPILGTWIQQCTKQLKSLLFSLETSVNLGYKVFSGSFKVTLYLFFIKKLDTYLFYFSIYFFRFSTYISIFSYRPLFLVLK